MTIKRYLAAFSTGAFLMGAFFYGSYLYNVRSTLASTTGMEFAFSYQVYHNNANGFPLQSSICGVGLPGANMQAPYVNFFALHFYVLPFSLIYLLAANQSVIKVLSIYLFGNLLPALLFTWLILRRLAPEGWKPRFAFAASILLITGSLNLFGQQGAPPLFAGPCIFGAYYFLIAGKRSMFLASMVALCLVSEEMAMVALSFSVYIFLIEPERKSYAWPSGLFALFYLALVVGLLQPLARTFIGATEPSTAVAFAKLVGPALLKPRLSFMFTLLAVPPAFVLGTLLFGRPDSHEIKRLCALVILAPLPLWGACVVLGGDHHLICPYVFIYLALVRQIGAARGVALPSTEQPRWIVVFTATLILFFCSFRVMAQHLPIPLRAKALRLAGRIAKANELGYSLSIGKISNRAVIEIANSLPPDRSLVFWANNSVSGFISGRHSVWFFPYLYNKADYLLIQKDAYDIKFTFDPSSAPDLGTALKITGKEYWTEISTPMKTEVVRSILEELVTKSRTHRIFVDNNHVLLLEKLRPQPFVGSPASVGFGWARNLLPWR